MSPRLQVVLEGAARRGRGGRASAEGAAAELVRVMAAESAAVSELREALLRQRAGVATGSAEGVAASCDDIGRILLTLGEAHRQRGALLEALTGDASAPLETLEGSYGGELPAALAAARDGLRREAGLTATEATINRAVLRSAVEAGESFLQALFSAAGDPEPVYRTPERRDDAGQGFLLDRRA